MSSPEPEFGSVGEADAAYYGSSNDGGGNNQNNQNGDQNSNQNGNGTSYGELQRIEFLAGEWALVYQDARASDRQRFFVLKSDGETIQAIEADGVVVEAMYPVPAGIGSDNLKPHHLRRYSFPRGRLARRGEVGDPDDQSELTDFEARA